MSYLRLLARVAAVPLALSLLALLICAAALMLIGKLLVVALAAAIEDVTSV